MPWTPSKSHREPWPQPNGGRSSFRLQNSRDSKQNCRPDTSRLGHPSLISGAWQVAQEGLCHWQTYHRQNGWTHDYESRLLRSGYLFMPSKQHRRAAHRLKRGRATVGRKVFLCAAKSCNSETWRRSSHTKIRRGLLFRPIPGLRLGQGVGPTPNPVPPLAPCPAPLTCSVTMQQQGKSNPLVTRGPVAKSSYWLAMVTQRRGIRVSNHELLNRWLYLFLPITGAIF
jgi:hypothetical protein